MAKFLQISLRSLLLLVTLFGLWLGLRANRAHHQRKAVKEILRHSGDVEYQLDGAKREFSYHHSPSDSSAWLGLWDADYRGSVRLVRIIGLNTHPDRETVERRILPAVFALRDLECITLSDMAITNDDLHGLSRHHALRSLYLESTAINEGDIDGLIGLKLDWLCVARTRFSDRGLESLKNMQTLKYLDLTRTKVSDVGLVHLERLANLQHLNLSRTKVTQEGAAELQRKFPHWNIAWEPLVFP